MKNAVNGGKCSEWRLRPTSVVNLLDFSMQMNLPVSMQEDHLRVGRLHVLHNQIGNSALGSKKGISR